MIKTALGCLCFVAFACTTASAQNYRYGMNVHDVSGMTSAKMTELGADVVRVIFQWDIIEPSCKGCFNWAPTDAWRDEAARSRRVIFGTLAFTPRWANGGGPFSDPPLDFRDWYDFVYAVVDRYKDDVFLWGIWNEPNLQNFLRNGDLKLYGALAGTAHAAIRAANPDALVLGPEVSHHAMTNGWFTAAMKGLGHLFDIVTVHWYPDGPDLGKMMDDLVRPLAMRKSIWLTEAGQSPCGSTFGEAGQALFYQRVLQAFEPRRSWWTSVMFYDLHDSPAEQNCGPAITRPDWSNRPAFSLYQAFIRSHP